MIITYSHSKHKHALTCERSVEQSEVEVITYTSTVLYCQIVNGFSFDVCEHTRKRLVLSQAWEHTGAWYCHK